MKQCIDYEELQKYKNQVQAIGNIKDFDQLNEAEWEGCLGVACMMSIIDGVPPDIYDISEHLHISYSNEHLQLAFERLRINGIFSHRFGARNDPSLTKRARKNGIQSKVDVEKNAWCLIAGIASGFTGMKD